ncbi:putative Queuine tRNA-ribosyltransferase-like protein [Hyaloscypha hepaticicola]|uniref:Queuine tRNA-ribosyltransferase accessory subunit 2 n=1 Tax=Hyaloscypha hepaticicola TaxID=2082293 RepID=A0A2J6Q659_9HELO|nr:putative Queuine tRNA-ribosyltransferase-like protein [Hyaloscypha hepaticicola]
MFEVLSHVDPNAVGPRLGRLSITGRREFETPNFFALTSRGVIPHLTPDVIAAHTRVGGVHIALEDFIERAVTGTPPIMNCPGSSPLHTFTALPKALPTLLAPRRTPAVSAPNGNSNTAISIFTSTGFQVLSNKSYLSYIEKLQPDIAIALADVPYGTLPGTKRIAKMGDRTQEWLSQLLNEKRKEQVVFAPVLPIDFLDQSEYLNSIADDLADEVSGLAFYDSNLLPDIPATTAITDLPRLSLDEPSSPRQILRQISLGMDILTIPFVGFATDAGIALTFRFPRPLSTHAATSKGVGALQLGVDMWPAVHSTSVDPLDTSCTCYTCTSHHRAYVQHLLSAKEMLGWVLLQIHNHHILSEFFSSIRKSIKDGSFEADCEEFAKVYESEMPEKSGQGPRVRGYHFKSEGPGEPKKNKAAWGNLGSDDQEVDSDLVPDETADESDAKGFAGRMEA